MDNPILVVNAGSSSMKYQLIDPDEGQAVTTGLIERIGVAGAEPGRARHQQGGETFEFVGDIPDHAAAIEVMKGLFDRSGRPIERTIASSSSRSSPLSWPLSWLLSCRSPMDLPQMESRATSASISARAAASRAASWPRTTMRFSKPDCVMDG